MAHDPKLAESVARGICVEAYGKLGDPNGTEWPEFAHLATAALDAIEAAGCVVVPDAAHMTDDQAEAICGVVNVCGGIAHSIYDAALQAARPGADSPSVQSALAIEGHAAQLHMLNAQAAGMQPIRWDNMSEAVKDVWRKYAALLPTPAEGQRNG